MMRMHRREFLRLGAGVFAAAFFTNIPEFLLSSQSGDQWVVPKTARVSYLVGELKINGVRVGQGAVVNEGDILQTGDRSEADIEVRDYAIFHLKANSIVEIDDIFQNAGVTVKKGWFLTIVRSGKDFSVTTPMVLAGVRGTVLFVNVLDDSGMYLCDCNGKVDIEDLSVATDRETNEARMVKSIVSNYHTAFTLSKQGGKVKVARAGLLYHHDSDILKMAKRFQSETEVFRRRKSGGYS